MTLSRQEIVTHVDQILRSEFEIAAGDIVPTARLAEDLELDSLDAVDMIVVLEQQLRLTIDEEEAKKIRLVRDVYDFVEKMVHAVPASGDTAPVAFPVTPSRTVASGLGGRSSSSPN